MQVIQTLNGIFWGWLVAGILLGTGVFFTIRLKFPQIRYFTKLFGNLRESMKSEGGVSGFGALCAAVGGQVGTGSLVGVATALASGGPGAIFWMWMTALLGMPISFSEAVLGQLFREKNSDGTYRGGPAYYMEKGLHSKLLSVLFSISVMIGIGFFYAMIQSNSISVALTGVVDIKPLIAGLVLLALVCLVVFGGIKRLSEVSSLVVPFMALAYLVIAVIIVVMNIKMLPGVITLIFKSAFSFRAAAGGVAGYTIKEAFRYGVARGLFSNDAGNGTAPSMHASAVVKHPVNQGLAAMLGTFITTIIICSCTAFCILITGALDSGETGIALTQVAFHNALGGAGKWIVFLAMSLFGFTTLLADIYYGEVNLMSLVSEKPGAVTVYRIICCVFIIIGAVAPVPIVWDLVDLVSAFMVFFNVIALIGLARYVVYVLKDFVGQKDKGKAQPVWDVENDITAMDLTRLSDEQ
ncbi:sodium:alanine symporter family protein [Enterocloster sp. OA13]|uniref:alanine/glycine:cation symporter family protein n=1 Tax=Enterocloster sp. OA13 TaxID=2914161 RepID=UPI0004708AB4|nr:sodium:alanine symporter family protein [Enterocloster sp. OA13]